MKITILSQKELENEIMSTVQQYPELMSAMKSYNENHDFEKVSEDDFHLRWLENSNFDIWKARCTPLIFNHLN